MLVIAASRFFFPFPGLSSTAGCCKASRVCAKCGLLAVGFENYSGGINSYFPIWTLRLCLFNGCECVFIVCLSLVWVKVLSCSPAVCVCNPCVKCVCVSIVFVFDVIAESLRIVKGVKNRGYRGRRKWC